MHLQNTSAIAQKLGNKISMPPCFNAFIKTGCDTILCYCLYDQKGSLKFPPTEKGDVLNAKGVLYNTNKAPYQGFPAKCSSQIMSSKIRCSHVIHQSCLTSNKKLLVHLSCP